MGANPVSSPKEIILMTISVAQAQLFFLAFTRIMAILIHVPVLGGQTIPNQVRIGLGFVLAMVITQPCLLKHLPLTDRLWCVRSRESLSAR
jgi:flagellar biosynthesis protein FliR